MIKKTHRQLTYSSRVGTLTSFDKVFDICLEKLETLLGDTGKLSFTWNKEKHHRWDFHSKKIKKLKHCLAEVTNKNLSFLNLNFRRILYHWAKIPLNNTLISETFIRRQIQISKYRKAVLNLCSFVTTASNLHSELESSNLPEQSRHKKGNVAYF